MLSSPMPTSTISASPDLAEQYAAWACALRYADAPRGVRQALRNCLLYNLTMALAVDPADDLLGVALRLARFGVNASASS